MKRKIILFIFGLCHHIPLIYCPEATHKRNRKAAIANSGLLNNQTIESRRQSQCAETKGIPLFSSFMFVKLHANLFVACVKKINARFAIQHDSDITS